MHKLRKIFLTLATLLALGCGGADPTPLAIWLDGPWCMTMSGECASEPGELTLALGYAYGTLAVLDDSEVDTSQCLAGDAFISGAAYPQSLSSYLLTDYASLIVSGYSASGLLSFSGAISDAGGGGDWWSSTGLTGTFEVTAGECPAMP